MNTVVTSREGILAAAKRLAADRGFEALNVRAVAQAGGISVGSVYNYFPSKAHLLAAVVREIWKEITGTLASTGEAGFADAVRALFAAVRVGSFEYPAFFAAHAACFASADRATGRAVMGDFFGRMKARFLAVLEADPMVRDDAFDEELTAEVFVEFVFSHLLILLERDEACCETLLQVIRRVIY